MDDLRCPLTPDEARELSARIRAGDRAARAEFVASLLGWLHQWAGRARRLRYRAEDVDELTQELALDLAGTRRPMTRSADAHHLGCHPVPGDLARWSRRARHPGGVTHVALGRLRVMSLDAPLYDDDACTLGDCLAAPSGRSVASMACAWIKRWRRSDRVSARPSSGAPGGAARPRSRSRTSPTPGLLARVRAPGREPRHLPGAPGARRARAGVRPRRVPVRRAA